MKCRILFAWGKKNKKNTINLSSAELAERVVKVKVMYYISRVERKTIVTQTYF